MPIGAIIGSTVASTAVGLSGQKKAADASKNALAAQMAQQDKVWGAVNPFMQAGTSALGQISDPSKVLGNFQASPDYNYRVSQALNGVTTNKAVNGLLRSGSALSAVTQKASDLAGSEFGSWWNRQTGLANQGLQADAIGAGVANQNTAAIGANATNQGNAAIAGSNTINQGIGSIADLIGKYGTPASTGGGGASSYGGTSLGGGLASTAAGGMG